MRYNSFLIVCTAALAALAQPRAHAVTASDRMFIEKAAKGNAAEVKLAELALQKSADTKVKGFANQMITDHSKANTDLKPVAEALQVPWSTELKGEPAATYKRLSALSGAGFDKEYLAAMMKDHEKDLDEYQQEQGVASDPQLRAYVTKTTPVISRHLDHLKSLKVG